MDGMPYHIVDRERNTVERFGDFSAVLKWTDAHPEVHGTGQRYVENRAAVDTFVYAIDKNGDLIRVAIVRGTAR